MKGRPFPIYLILAYSLWGVVGGLLTLLVAIPTFAMGGLEAWPFIAATAALSILLSGALFIAVFLQKKSAVFAALVLLIVDIAGKIFGNFALEKMSVPFLIFGLVSTAIPASILWYLNGASKAGDLK